MFICGIDEVGRGPLAGPVVASAVILGDSFFKNQCEPIKLNDSKKMSKKNRLFAEKVIKKHAVAWAIASVDHSVIDTINILQASMRAMEQAFFKLQMLVDMRYSYCCIYSVVDGNKLPKIAQPAQTLVKADSLIPEVMAAAILAKNYRDNLMCYYDKLYPAYLYAKHKGYPTLAHRKICHELGPSPIQRLSFKY